MEDLSFVKRREVNQENEQVVPGEDAIEGTHSPKKLQEEELQKNDNRMAN